jgi:hypothetical protein
VEIGDWRATRDLNDLYRELRDRGLETNVAELEAFGFTVIEDALSPDLIDRLRAALLADAERRHERAFDIENETDLEGVSLLSYLLFKDTAFEEALLLPGPLALVTYLMGQSCLLSSVTCHFKGPGGAGLGLHADNANGAPAPFAPHSQVANCNFALTDYSEEDGAFAVVPGSHRLARQPTRHEVNLDGAGRNPDVIAVEVPAGSAIVYHGNTWHGSFSRKRPGLRINLALYFCRQNVQPQENYKDHVPEAALGRHRDNPRFARLLGAETAYGWTEEGPDFARLGRAARAGSSWHG